MARNFYANTLAFSCEVVHEKLWKSVNICKSYSKKISGTFFSGHGVEDATSVESVHNIEVIKNGSQHLFR